ncbi:MAG: FlgK family flagellar hook-associated protein, partial [Sulfuricella sp.]
VPSRQAMLSSAQTMVARFQAINQRFTEIRDGVNSEIRSSVGVVNSYAKQIASLNQQIGVAQGAAGDQQPANDLLDQRDQLIGELNKIIKVSTVKQTDGSLNVFIGNGQSLVLGAQSFTLAAAPSPEGPESLDVGMSFGGSTVPLPKGSLQGGSLGGLLAFRDEALDPAQNALGRVAIGLAQTFNDQHKLGMDLNGLMGGSFFNVATPKVISNTGNSLNSKLNVNVADASKLTTSDYRLTYNGSTATLTRLSDNATLFSGATLPQTVDGLAFLSPITAAAGDSFLIKPTIDGASAISVKLTDTSAIAAAAPIKTNATLSNTGSGMISAGSVNTGTPVTPDPLHPATDLNLLEPITIKFTSRTNFDVFDTATTTAIGTGTYTPGNDITYNGWTVQISGTPEATDTFTVSSNANGVADNRNALLLAGLQTQNTLAGSTTPHQGTTNYQGAYSQLVSFVGNKTSEIEVTAKAQASLVSQTQQAQQSMSGVNLDEEAANLMRYQQAYQAAGKMMQIASTLFATLLSLGH